MEHKAGETDMSSNGDIFEKEKGYIQVRSKSERSHKLKKLREEEACRDGS